MKLIDRIKRVEGVEECWYNFDSMKLTVFLKKCEVPPEGIKARVIDAVVMAALENSVSKIDFYDA